MANTLLTKLGIPKEVIACRDFDEVLQRHYFEKLSEKQQIAIYNYFTSIENQKEKAIPYTDLEDVKKDFQIEVEGDSTSVSELLDEGYYIRQCKEKGRPFRALAAWRDEGEEKYLRVAYVAPEFRRQGLLRGLIDDGYDGRPITAKIHTGNHPALKAAIKHGFDIQQKTGDYYMMFRA